MVRVWDAFLTEQDRAHIAASPRKPTPLGDRPALLSVDNYRNVLGDEPQPLLEAIKTWPSSTGLAGWRAIEKIRELMEFCRANNYPVAHATGLTEEESGIPSWNFYRSPAGWSQAGGARGWEAMRTRGSDLRERLASMLPEERERYERRYDIVEEVAPLPGEIVVRKTSPSAFWQTGLAATLAAMEVDTLVVVGESTSGCVRASVVDAASERIPVVVVEDCVYDRHEAAHAINLFDMHRKYADVMPLDDTLAYLKNVAS